jgi:hypothetical protein
MLLGLITVKVALTQFWGKTRSIIFEEHAFEFKFHFKLSWIEAFHDTQVKKKNYNKRERQEDKKYENKLIRQEMKDRAENMPVLFGKRLLCLLMSALLQNTYQLP